MFPSPARLVLLAVLLPFAVALVNQVLFEASRKWEVARSAIYPSLAVSAAVLSWCVGRYLHPPWLRWLIFAWCLALLDLQTLASGLGGGQPFAFVLISAQLNLVVLWTVLADVGWQTRLPGTAAAITILILFAANWRYRDLSVLVYLAAFVVLLVCVALRWKGYLLRRSEIPAAGTVNTNQSNLLRTNQFGIKHMLLWATALAPLLIVGRTFDYLVFANLSTRAVFPTLLISFSLAIVTLTSIWAVLGAGMWAVRIAALVLVPLLLSVGLEAYSSFTRPIRGGFWQWGPVYTALWDLEGLWTMWLWLNASMLAALLLFVRANGYALVRNLAKPPS